MKYIILGFFAILQGCSDGSANRTVNSERGYLLSSFYNGDILEMKNHKDGFVVFSYPDGFFPPMPNLRNGSCIYIANEVIFSGIIDKKGNRISLTNVKLLKRVGASDVGKITPSFKSSMIC